MILAKVLGSAVATAKHPSYRGHKVLLVQPIDLDQKDLGGSFLAVDSVQAGVGDQVLVAREGNAARQVLDAGNAPIHSVILAIVDEIDVDPQNT